MNPSLSSLIQGGALVTMGGVVTAAANFLRTRLRTRVRLDDNSLKRELYLLDRLSAAEKATAELRGEFDAKLAAMEQKLQAASREKHGYRNAANAANIALIFKIVEINGILAQHGQPAKYDVKQESLRALREITEAMNLTNGDGDDVAPPDQQ